MKICIDKQFDQQQLIEKGNLHNKIDSFHLIENLGKIKLKSNTFDAALIVFNVDDLTSVLLCSDNIKMLI